MSFQPIRERDASGSLVAAGYEWEEDKDTPGLPLYLLTCAGVVAALIGLWVALVGDAVIGTPIIGGGLVVAWLSHRAQRAYGHDKRALVFRTDDTVVAPYGLAGGQALGTMPVKVSEIINVAYDLRYDTPYVALSLRDGRKIDVIGNRGIEDDEGQLIHTEITTNAWKEIRRVRAV